MSRLSIDITEQQHQSLKAMAALQSKKLKILLSKRINDAISGDVSSKSISEILDEELALGGS